MGIAMFLLAAVAAQGQTPDVPKNVQLIAENGSFVMRTLPEGKPLYTFDKDEPNKSNCTDRCLQAWPALPAAADAKPVGKWSVIARGDGTSQWAYEGKPVYTFVRDTEGKATGDGMGGAWHLLPTIPAK